jgi:hypothetical protein
VRTRRRRLERRPGESGVHAENPRIAPSQRQPSKLVGVRASERRERERTFDARQCVRRVPQLEGRGRGELRIGSYGYGSENCGSAGSGTS